ncbi:MAG TPA: hypothetical protein VMW63_02350 [Methanoregulaceae archaeon]|nr:hypothetical protein [Methanoregulaceae archaeon]
MSPDHVYAVVTGDVVGSSKLPADKRKILLQCLDSGFDAALRVVDESASHLPPFEVFRGDSFQGILSKADQGLRAALIIRASLLAQPEIRKGIRLDTRIAIGVGPVQFVPKERVGLGDGDAYRFSGGELETLKKRKVNLMIKTPWDSFNDELRTESFLADAIIRSWSPAQAEAMLYALSGATQAGIAHTLGISQEAVFYRLDGAKNWAIQEFLSRYKEIISKSLSNGVNE